MATFFRNTVTKEIGLKPVEVLQTSIGARATVIGLSLTNLTNDFVYVSILVEDDTSVQGYYLKDTVIPANTSLRAVNQGEKLIVAAGSRILVQSSVTDSIDAIVSYVEIT